MNFYNSKYMSQHNKHQLNIQNMQAQLYNCNEKKGQPPNTSTMFCEQVNTVMSLFEKWNDCERTVVMYALLKRLRYPSLKFLQYSIENHVQHYLDKHEAGAVTSELDRNANNSSYLQNLLNFYKISSTQHNSTYATDAAASSLVTECLSKISLGSSQSPTAFDFNDNKSLDCFDVANIATARSCSSFCLPLSMPLISNKDEVLLKFLILLPLLNPKNTECKHVYMTLISIAIDDTLQQQVSSELVQQILSYLLIHSAISSEDRKSLNVWLRYLEKHLKANSPVPPLPMKSSTSCTLNSLLNNEKHHIYLKAHTQPLENRNFGCELTTSSESAIFNCKLATFPTPPPTSTPSSPNISSTLPEKPTYMSTLNQAADWQIIAPPKKIQRRRDSYVKQQQPLLCGNKIYHENASPPQQQEQINCDKLKSISFEDMDLFRHGQLQTPDAIFSQINMSTIVANGNLDLNSDFVEAIHEQSDLDTSFSKNGNEILDYEPISSCTTTDATAAFASAAGGCGVAVTEQKIFEHANFNGMPSFQSLVSECAKNPLKMENNKELEKNRGSLDNNKLSVLKTRRSNSLTTQAISFSSSLSTSTYANSALQSSYAVTNVMDNANIYSTSAENLVYSKNKQRSFSLSLEYQRDMLTNSGSETRLDDLKKPNLYKFTTQNVGMSCVGLWLKSLRLHKYIELFKNMTFENMLKINEEYLLSIGVTKGASHKLSLCIEKLNERPRILACLESELVTNSCKTVMQKKVRSALDELVNMAMTPMKPVETVNTSITGECNVALEFLKVLKLVVTIVQKEEIVTKDDEHINLILYIVERAMYNDAFLKHTNDLKELKLRLYRLKTTITPKAFQSKIPHVNSKKSR